MIHRLLIANRGEIAVRVIRSCRELGIEAVAVYSEADKDSLHVRMADRAVCIGQADSKSSYLNKRNLIAAAVASGCDAVHPGVGFLSENADFAADVEKAGLIFIGPRPETIAFLGDKVAAKRTAQEAGLPVIPGSEGAVEDAEAALSFARKVGFPVIVKAASGGGGKGMRIVRDESQLASAMKIAGHEAETAFSDGTLYLEKYLENPRHVEVQLLGDGKGNVVHLGERDCSMQLRHQKLVEESPSPGISPAIREDMCSNSVRLFEKLSYRGAGTIEFLFDGENYYFMEVNARVQVEHPVSEMVSGVDIIKAQIRGAVGEELGFNQRDITIKGSSIECRINALAPGTVSYYLPPGGVSVRVDSFLYPGYKVPPYYDAMVAKLIVHGSTRREAINRMLRALDEFVIDGLSVNLATQKRIVSSPIFQSGRFGTSALETILKEV
ncbi:acetyl-CoA carboxylase biotin carboxylase subunit [Sediminispirochaeta smaragdinae]|uniref:Biotin carboxylase n=1 Tax=Sediminispirochaeta smaragdinae (strain DSM 11293 / JCM 15392 / SEBR 4228) TaxID=573413 RepID=E1R1N4_SEDSS|nr:acetyl-CoA carboxylase biotin carboxylase subunit [Sediminispirochaeta smaragdinae]ADK81410.1 acetyl-CoA carboxylase, biotin carboxylase [Sediminispirochaeta smaragdinae DSM 11293]